MIRHPEPVTGAISLQEHDPRDRHGMKRDEIEERDGRNLVELDRLTSMMYAAGNYSLLIILQGMDASGKNSTTKHLARGINPDGLEVHSFKQPTEIEADHDYFWRVHNVTPRRGTVGVFNRSHYEEVLIARAEPKVLQNSPLPRSIVSDPNIFEQRFRQINDFERMLTENGTVIMKFFLHISRGEQIERLKERIDNPKKRWKFALDDLRPQKEWDTYQRLFEEMLDRTSTSYAPWYIVPADRKWFRNWYVTRAIIDRIGQLELHYPDLANREELLKKIEEL